MHLAADYQAGALRGSGPRYERRTMDDSENRTLQEWRELRGLSREELAEQTGVDADLIARLEELGDPTYGPDTWMGGEFAREVISPLADALGTSAEAIRMDVVPEEPMPGYYVLDILALEQLDPEIAEFLWTHAESLALRRAGPSRWGVVLTTLEHADTQETAETIFAWRQRNGWRGERRERTLQGADEEDKG
jgi:transcriptional regulator with XRE-family HTH domain